MKAYQLKIQIQDSHPPIWRRLIVPAGLSFSQLSILLNETMGWCGYHLSSFEFFHQKIRIEEKVDEFDDWGWNEYELLEAGETLIDEFLDDEKWFTYIYDFGDNWRHRVTIEKVLTDYENNYAQIIKYKGDTPYEDCGGIYGYYDLLEILNDTKHPEYEQMKGWTENHFTEKFDVERVNERLKELYLSDKVSDPMTQNEIYEEIITKSCPFKRIQVGEELPFIDEKAPYWDEMKLYEDMKKMTLRDILKEYSRNELVEIAKNLHLSGYSSLKKEKLLDRMSVDLLDRDVMRKAFRFLSEAELKFLEQEEKFLEIDALSIEYDTLFDMGYAYCESNWPMEIMYVPKEVKAAFRANCDEEWKRGALRDQEFLMYLNCTAELYGICPIHKALELYRRDCGGAVNEFGVVGFCETVPENKKIFVIQEGKLVLRMLTRENLVRDILAMHKNFDYYEPTTEEIQLLGKKGYLPFSRELNDLKKFFRKYGEETEADAEDLCKRVQFLVRIGEQIDGIMEMLEECYLGFEEVVLDEKRMDMLMEKLFLVIQTTRTFILRGHSPQEVMPEIAKIVQKKEQQENVIPFPKKK